MYRSDAAGSGSTALPPPSAPAAADDTPRPARCPVARIDRLVSPVALALTIVLAPFGGVGRRR